MLVGTATTVNKNKSFLITLDLINSSINCESIQPMKDNEIIEVLEDGTVHYYDLEVCNKEAYKLLDELYAKEGKVLNFDATATIFALFLESVQVLSYAGWTIEDLMEVVIENAQPNYDDSEDDGDDDSDY